MHADKESRDGTAVGGTGGAEPSFVGGLHARALRLRRKLTLDQLAAAASLSKGHLSRFERGEKALSVAALMRLAQALETSTSTLLGEELGEDAVHVVRAGTRRVTRAPTEAGAYRFALLSRSAEGGELDVFTIELSADMAVTGRETHAGQESFFVLEGEVSVEVGDRTYHLGKGDYLEFPGSLHHVAVSRTDTSSVLVIVARR